MRRVVATRSGSTRPVRSAPLHRTDVAGEATFSGGLARVLLARDAVRSRLPACIELPQSTGARCPCLVAFGEQADGRTFFAGFATPWAVRYHELMVGVPLVSRNDGNRNGQYLFILGMTCDFWPAVWNGNVFYGFQKRFATMESEVDGLSVEDDKGARGFRAFVRPKGAARTAFAWIESAAALPVLGQRSDGAIVQSHFDWSFDQAAVQPAAIRLVVGGSFAELPPGEYADDAVDGCAVTGMRWRLGWPEAAS
jgi:hypothetical protein